jgi:hypothetical protein
MTDIATWIDTVTTALFLYVVVGFLLLTGLFLTIRLGVVQLRRLPEAFRAMVAQQSKGATGGALSPFQAFMTALGASIGTGNIAGVATAIISGGPARCSGSGSTASWRRRSNSAKRSWASDSASCAVPNRCPGRCTTSETV